MEIGFVFRDLGGDLLGSDSEGGRIVDEALGRRSKSGV